MLWIPEFYKSVNKQPKLNVPDKRPLKNNYLKHQAMCVSFS